MLPAYISARLLEKQRAAESSEFARQLPLYTEEPSPFHAPSEAGERVAGNEPAAQPDWMTNY